MITSFARHLFASLQERNKLQQEKEEMKIKLYSILMIKFVSNAAGQLHSMIY